MSKSLLPLHEPLEFHNRDIAYRDFINDYNAKVDLNPLSCEASLLPHLAQVVQVLYWSKLLSEDEQRLLIANSKMLHKHLGTPFAIKKVFELLNREAKLIEWFEDDTLESYHFKVALYDHAFKGYSKEHVETFEMMLEIYKNVRSVLDEIKMNIEVENVNYCSVAMVTEELIEVFPQYAEQNLNKTIELKMPIGTEVEELIEVFPQYAEQNLNKTIELKMPIGIEVLEKINL